jgi:radical SAM protein with 4Fe4S-binding SPASM domain
MKINILGGKIFLLKKHFIPIISHITFIKVVNILVNQIELLLRFNKLYSKPVFLKIEPSRACNLKCPQCIFNRPEIKNEIPEQPYMKFEDFKKVIKPFRNTLFLISLSGNGEPMLNKNLISMISLAHSYNIGVDFPTNFSIKLSDDYLKKIIFSGLDRIFVSCDGASAATYAQYRRNGNFDLVLSNVYKLAQLKKQLGKRNPHIIWKFIVFAHNKHEVEFVINNYKGLGFDSIILEYDAQNNNIYDKHIKKIRSKETACFWPYSSMNISWNGKVSPCCDNIYSWEIGNAFITDLDNIWNSTTYRLFRKGFNYFNYGQYMVSRCKKCFRLN